MDIVFKQRSQVHLKNQPELTNICSMLLSPSTQFTSTVSLQSYQRKFSTLNEKTFLNTRTVSTDHVNRVLVLIAGGDLILIIPEFKFCVFLVQILTKFVSKSGENRGEFNFSKWNNHFHTALSSP
jgi:hypothetical protein